MINALRGEYTAVLAGESRPFDTTLGTVARIEEACGGRAIMEIINAAVVGRRAADQIPLITAALRAIGTPEAETVAAQTTLPEAEAFLLALMGALGFKLATREGDAAEPGPLAGSRDGGAGAPSRSAA